MLELKPIYIEAVDIPDAWFQCISSILDNGFKYEIQNGSFVGQTRLEFDHITINIKKPYAEPYDLMLPQIPAHLNIPNPVENGYIEQYMPYLMTAEKKDEEEYTYGERLVSYFKPKKIKTESGYDICNLRIEQISYWIGTLKKTPNTNQAILQVGEPIDYNLKEPPCLRHIDMRIRDNTLVFYPYFRSNDLWSGFPANLAGLAVLQKYMADEIGVESGPMVYTSKGLHIYGYCEELAKIRAYKK